MLLLLGCSLGVYALIDRHLFHRALKVVGIYLAQTALVGAYMWALFRFCSLWGVLLWLFLLIVLVAYLSLGKVRLPAKSFLPLLALALLLGMAVASGCLLLSLRSSALSLSRLLLPVGALLSFHLYASLSRGLQTYIGSLMHTATHYQYLMANGSTHLEAIMPSVRRSMRAVALSQLKPMLGMVPAVPPVLFCGLLLGGASPLASAFVSALVALSGFVASVVAMLVVLVLGDRLLFDKRQQFVYWPH